MISVKLLPKNQDILAKELVEQSEHKAILVETNDMEFIEELVMAASNQSADIEFICEDSKGNKTIYTKDDMIKAFNDRVDMRSSLPEKDEVS